MFSDCILGIASPEPIPTLSPANIWEMLLGPIQHRAWDRASDLTAQVLKPPAPGNVWWHC